MPDKKKRAAALLLSLCLLLSGCGGNASEETQTAGTEEETGLAGQAVEDRAAADSVFSVNYDPDSSLNPIKAESSTNMQLWSLLYDEVFTVNADYSVSSELVVGYTSTDYIWWTFNIDTSIQFSDGSYLTAQDVVYSIRQAQQRSYYSGRLSVIYGISAMSDDTFAVTTQYADSQLPALLNIPVIKNGSIDEDVPLGTGPYVLSKDGDSLVLSEYSRHTEDMPLDTIYLKSYMDASEKISAFEDALLDIVTNDPTGTYNLGYGSSNETRYFDTTNMHYIGFNFTGTYFQNAQARYAVNYIIDRDGIVSECLQDGAVASALPALPGSAVYDADYAATLSYDPEKSLALFSSANVGDHDNDGELEFMVTGIVVETDIDFIVNNDSTTKVQAARKIAEELNAIGIKTTLRELSWDEYMYALQSGDYDMYYGEVRLTPDWNYGYLLNPDGGLNYSNCSDSGFYDSCASYLAASDDTRASAFTEACRYLIENGGLIPICFERRQLLTHRNVVSGLAPTQYDMFNDIENWTVTLQ